MNLNWVLSNRTNQKLTKECVDFEYQLRPKIIQFLMARFENECQGDFSSFYFDVDMATQWVSISTKTPEKYIKQIQDDFDLEINGISHLNIA